MPSRIPTGRATTKLPLTTRMRLLAIGVLGRPWENAASTPRRIAPAASLTHSSEAAIGDAPTGDEGRGHLLEREQPLHLRPRAVHDDQADAHRLQQRQVVDQAFEAPVLDQFAAEADHEGAPAVRMHVWRDLAQPGDELGLRQRFAGRGRCGRGAAAGGAG